MCIFTRASPSVASFDVVAFFDHLRTACTLIAPATRFVALNTQQSRMDVRNLSTFYVNSHSVTDLPSLTLGDQQSYSLPSTATSQREADAGSPISVGHDSGTYVHSMYAAPEDPSVYPPSKMAAPLSRVPARALADSGPGVDSLTGTATSMRLFISKLPNSMTRHRLRDYITNHLIMQGVPHTAATNCLLDVYQPNGDNGRLRNFAFVSFSDRSYLDLLLATGPGPGGVHLLDGRAVLMDVAAPRGLKVKQDMDEHGRLLGTVSMAPVHTGMPSHVGPGHMGQRPGPHQYPPPQGYYGPGRDQYDQGYSNYGPNAGYGGPYAPPPRGGPWYGGDVPAYAPSRPVHPGHGAHAGMNHQQGYGQQQHARGAYDYTGMGAQRGRGGGFGHAMPVMMGGGFNSATTTPAGLPPSLQRGQQG